jgi:prespore-specific regulator
MDIQKAERKNAWSNSDDILLATAVIDHLKKGSTQVKAFEEASKLLNRSTSACTFRWNGVVRKQYENEIQQIKDEIQTITEAALEEESLVKQMLSINKEYIQGTAPLQPELDKDSIYPLSTIIESVEALKNKIDSMCNYVNDLESKLIQKDQVIAQLQKEASIQMNNSAEVSELINFLQKVKKTGILEKLG